MGTLALVVLAAGCTSNSAARALPADTRMHRERIEPVAEPVAEPVGDLDPQMNLREADLLLSEHLRHTGSGIWAVPPEGPDGATIDGADGASTGQRLFEG